LYIFFNKNQYEYSEDGECLISLGEGDGDDENNSERMNVCTKEQSKKSLIIKQSIKHQKVEVIYFHTMLLISFVKSVLSLFLFVVDRSLLL
jgi:hypothetical protein